MDRERETRERLMNRGPVGPDVQQMPDRPVNECGPQPYRMKAHGCLLERIAELRNEADRLERLYRWHLLT